MITHIPSILTIIILVKKFSTLTSSSWLNSVNLPNECTNKSYNVMGIIICDNLSNIKIYNMTLHGNLHFKKIYTFQYDVLKIYEYQIDDIILMDIMKNKKKKEIIMCKNKHSGELIITGSIIYLKKIKFIKFNEKWIFYTSNNIYTAKQNKLLNYKVNNLKTLHYHDHSGVVYTDGFDQLVKLNFYKDKKRIVISNIRKITSANNIHLVTFKNDSKSLFHQDTHKIEGNLNFNNKKITLVKAEKLRKKIIFSALYYECDTAWLSFLCLFDVSYGKKVFGIYTTNTALIKTSSTGIFFNKEPQIYVKVFKWHTIVLIHENCKIYDSYDNGDIFSKLTLKNNVCLNKIEFFDIGLSVIRVSTTLSNSKSYMYVNYNGIDWIETINTPTYTISINLINYPADPLVFYALNENSVWYSFNGCRSFIKSDQKILTNFINSHVKSQGSKPSKIFYTNKLAKCKYDKKHYKTNVVNGLLYFAETHFNNCHVKTQYLMISRNYSIQCTHFDYTTKFGYKKEKSTKIIKKINPAKNDSKISTVCLDGIMKKIFLEGYLPIFNNSKYANYCLLNFTNKTNTNFTCKHLQDLIRGDDDPKKKFKEKLEYFEIITIIGMLLVFLVFIIVAISVVKDRNVIKNKSDVKK
ncbi:hypothetical protein A3Q56_00025 [Intoshia linei]|uniref:Uncharacterized protein n=1 Tax=Intoshia linei TaxID=1819745 RepID=A0A177BD33_9BILA|nr:hypothetical protein A3Q56_00025 [Intoshia linei]